MDSLAEYKILGCISFFSGFHFLASSESTENFCMVSVPGHMFEIYFYFGSFLQFWSTLSSSRIHRFIPAIIPVCIFISESSVDAVVFFWWFFFCSSSLFIYQCEIVFPSTVLITSFFYSIFLETLVFSMSLKDCFMFCYIFWEGSFHLNISLSNHFLNLAAIF